MKFSIFCIVAATVAADNQKWIFLIDAIDQIPTIQTPPNDHTFDIDESSAKKIEFETKPFQPEHENFALLKTMDSGEIGPNYEIVAFARHTENFILIDESYSGRIEMNFLNAQSIKVSINDVTAEDKNRYFVIAITDPMSTKYETVKVDVDNTKYGANMYNGSVGAKYFKHDGKWLLYGWQEASSGAAISFSGGLAARPATDAERYAADLTASATVMVVSQPIDDWFLSHAGESFIEVKTEFSSKNVLRFINANDIRQNVNPVLVGWNVEFECGPVPADAVNVQLVAGKDGTVNYSDKRAVSSIATNGDNLQFKSVQATKDMVGKAGGLSCQFFDGGDNTVGMSIPQAYAVHDAETPRPNIEVVFTNPSCGFDASGNSQEVAYCKVPDAEMAGVFPPVLLQWEIIHADGSSEKIPESPKETMALPLDIVVSEAYSGSRLICHDTRSVDPNGSTSPKSSTQTSPSNDPAMILRKHTTMVSVSVSSNSVTCASDAFGELTVNEEPCSDIVTFEDVYNVCPSTITVGNATCTATLTDDSILTQEYLNEDCLASYPGEVDCLKSANKKCDPPLNPDAGAGEAKSSKTWLLFFVFAAIGGCILVFLNKRKPSGPTSGETETKSEDRSDEENSLVESKEAFVIDDLEVVTEVAEPTAVKSAAPATMEELTPEEPKNAEIPLIDDAAKN